MGGIVIKNHFAKNLPNLRRPSRPLSGAFRRGARPARFHFALPAWVQCTTARRWSVRPTGTETSGASVHRASSLGGWAFGASTSCLRSGMASLSLWSNELFVRMTAILIRARLVVQVHPGPPFKSPVNTRLSSLFPFSGISLKKPFCQPFVNFTFGRMALHSGCRECCPVMSKDVQGSARHCKAVEGVGSDS